VTKVLRKASFIALAALCSAVVVSGCSGSNNPDQSAETDPNAGSVGLAVQVAPGVVVNTVHYVVTGNGANIAGDIPVAQAGSTISVQVGLPAGNNYSIQLTGVSTDGNTHCIGTESFNVTAGVTGVVHVKLQCDGVHVLGAARVDGTLNVCPTVNSYTVAPLQVAVGNDITVTSTASDVDPGTTLIYSWTATAGSFAAPASANTVYHCSAPGTQTLTVTVADGPDTTDPATQPCKDHADVQVSCVALACGNGTIDAGETCDHGATNGQPGDTCSAVCTLKCGNGTVDTAAGETCEPPGSISCDAQCHTITGCGNGVIEAGEQCDHGLGVGNTTGSATCDATCKTRCGNGVIDTGEQCDPNASPTGAPAGSVCSATCSTQSLCGNGVVDTGEQCDPTRIKVCTATCQTDACRACELATTGTNSANARVTACESAVGNAAAGPAAGQPKATLCKAVLDCARTNACTNSGLNPEYCYCGNGVDISVCLSGVPAGVCKSQIEAGAESTVPTDVGARFQDPGYATGLAFRLINADRLQCASTCF
jgi:cysteine-rich repeat protein